MSDLHHLELAREPLHALVREFDETGDSGEQGVVGATCDARSWADWRAALANDDVANFGVFACVLFGTQTLALRIAAVRGRTTSFFVCHKIGKMKWA